MAIIIWSKKELFLRAVKKHNEIFSTPYAISFIYVYAEKKAWDFFHFPRFYINVAKSINYYFFN